MKQDKSRKCCSELTTTIAGVACCSIVSLIAAATIFAMQPCAAAKKRLIDWEKKLEKGYYELSTGNTKKAIQLFKSKVKTYPDSGACHTALGQAYKKIGMFSEAKAEFRTSTAVEPSYAEGFYELGAMLESDKEYAQAIKAFERYLLLKPDSNRKGAVAERIRFCKERM